MNHPAIARDISEIFHCNLNDFEAELGALAKVRRYDEYTYLHCLNVARLSVGLGKKMGMTDQMLTDLGWAALLHDLGKLRVPIEILNKMNKFTPEELAVMQSHPLEALSAFAETHPVSLDRLRRLSAAFEHHQRYDLKGYPVVYQKKLSLHPFSRIVAIADTFDAMTTDRIYQRRILPDVALKIMAQGYGSIFDPFVLQAFITSMGVYPIGSLVQLSNDKLAVVLSYQESSELDRPRVVLLNAQNKADVTIDLMDEAHKSIRILQSKFPEDHGIRIGEVLRKSNLSEDNRA